MASSEHILSPTSQKRSHDAEPSLTEDTASPSSKRVCRHTIASHLAILEEFCDLSGEGESTPETQADESSTPEDLVEEMMRNLEKVIESDKNPEGCEITEENADLVCHDFSVESLCSDVEVRQALSDVERVSTDNSGRDDDISLLMQVSDDELGIPSCTSHFDDGNFEEEWASSTSDEPTAASYGWLDCSLLQIDDFLYLSSKELYEPVILFSNSNL